MSRSYRKYPLVIQEKDDCRYYNRKCRHAKEEELPKGAAYRRKYSSGWRWQYRWTREEAIRQFYSNEWIQKRYETLEAWLNYYEKCTIRK